MAEPLPPDLTADAPPRDWLTLRVPAPTETRDMLSRKDPHLAIPYNPYWQAVFLDWCRLFYPDFLDQQIMKTLALTVQFPNTAEFLKRHQQHEQDLNRVVELVREVWSNFVRDLKTVVTEHAGRSRTRGSQASQSQGGPQDVLTPEQAGPAVGGVATELAQGLKTSEELIATLRDVAPYDTTGKTVELIQAVTAGMTALQDSWARAARTLDVAARSKDPKDYRRLHRDVRLMQEKLVETHTVLKEKLKEVTAALAAKAAEEGFANLHPNWSQGFLVAETLLTLLGGIATAVGVVTGVALPVGIAAGASVGVFAAFKTAMKSYLGKTDAADPGKQSELIGRDFVDPKSPTVSTTNTGATVASAADSAARAGGHFPGSTGPSSVIHHLAQGLQPLAHAKSAVAPGLAAAGLVLTLLDAETRQQIDTMPHEQREALLKALGRSADHLQPDVSVSLVDKDIVAAVGNGRVRMAVKYDGETYLCALDVETGRLEKGWDWVWYDIWASLAGRTAQQLVVEGQVISRWAFFEKLAMQDFLQGADTIQVTVVSEQHHPVVLLVKQATDPARWELVTAQVDPSLDAKMNSPEATQAQIDRIKQKLDSMSDADFAIYLNPHSLTDDVLKYRAGGEGFEHHGIDWRNPNLSDPWVRLCIGYWLRKQLQSDVVPWLPAMDGDPATYDYRINPWY